MAKDKPTADPFPQLPRRGFYVGDETAPLNPANGLPTTRRFVPAVIEGPAVPAPKRGRPKSEASEAAKEPWKAEGISRKTWYKRKKDAALTPDKATAAPASDA